MFQLVFFKRSVETTSERKKFVDKFLSPTVKEYIMKRVPLTNNCIDLKITPVYNLLIELDKLTVDALIYKDNHEIAIDESRLLRESKVHDTLVPLDDFLFMYHLWSRYQQRFLISWPYSRRAEFDQLISCPTCSWVYPDLEPLNDACWECCGCLHISFKRTRVVKLVNGGYERRSMCPICNHYWKNTSCLSCNTMPEHERFWLSALTEQDKQPPIGSKWEDQVWVDVGGAVMEVDEETDESGEEFNAATVHYGEEGTEEGMIDEESWN